MSVRLMGEEVSAIEIVSDDSVLVVGNPHSLCPPVGDAAGSGEKEAEGTRETLVRWPAPLEKPFTLIARLRRFPDGETVWGDEVEIDRTIDSPADFGKHRFLWPEPSETGVYELTVERREFQPPRSRLWSRIGLEPSEITADHQTIYVRGNAPSRDKTPREPETPSDPIAWRSIGSVEPSQSSWLVLGSWLPQRFKPVLRRDTLASTDHLGESVSVLPAGHVFHARLPYGGTDQLHRITLEVPADQVAEWEMVVSRPGEESVAELKHTWLDRPPIQFDSATRTQHGWRKRSFIVPGRSDLQIWLTNRNATADANFKAIHVETAPISERPVSSPAPSEAVRKRYAYVTDDDWYESPSDFDRPDDSGGHWTADTLRVHAVMERCGILHWRAQFDSLTLVLPIQRCLAVEPWVASVALDVMNDGIIRVPAGLISEDPDSLSGWMFGEPQTVKLVVQDEIQRSSESQKEFLRTLHTWASSHQTKIDWLESVRSDQPAGPQILDSMTETAEHQPIGVIRWSPVAQTGTDDTRSNWMPQDSSLWVEPAGSRSATPGSCRSVLSSDAMNADRCFEPLDSRAWPVRTPSSISFAKVWATLPMGDWTQLPSSDPANHMVDVYQYENGPIVIANRSPWASAVDLKMRQRQQEPWNLRGAGTIENQSGKYAKIRLAPQAWIRLQCSDHARVESWTSVVADGIEVADEIKRRVTKIVENVGMLADTASNANVLVDQFEESSGQTTEGDSLSPWMHAQYPRGCVGSANDSFSDGQRCVRMTTTKTQSGRTWLVSPTIDPPASGRLGVSFACRQVATGDSVTGGSVTGGSATGGSATGGLVTGGLVTGTMVGSTTATEAIAPANANRIVELRLAFEGVSQGAPVRLAKVISIPSDQRWQAFPLALECEGLSAETIESLRLTVDLMTPGQIHLDDLRIVSDFVSRPRRTQIQKQSFLAVAGLKRGNLTYCIELLHNWDATELLWRDPVPSNPTGIESDADGGNDRGATLAAPASSSGSSRRDRPPAEWREVKSDIEAPSVADRIRTWIPNPFRY